MMQQFSVEKYVYANLVPNPPFLILAKNMINKNFDSLTQILKLLIWTPEVLKTFTIMNSRLISWFQSHSKQPTVKTHAWNFWDFCKYLVTKIIRKTAISTSFCFSLLPTLTMIKEISKSCVNWYYGFTKMYKRRGAIFKHIF